jgi:hypothetical protein
MPHAQGGKEEKEMRVHGHITIIAVLVLFVLTVLPTTSAFCAATQSTTPVEITAVKLAWVGVESSVSPKERGQKSFWKGSKPPTSTDYGSTDKMREVVASGNWGKMDVEFTTYRQWEDEIEFVFYMLLKDKDGFKMLKGTTKALYVAQGKGHYMVMYAYPNAIARYGADVQAIAVQAIVNGKVVSAASEPKVNKAWWEEYSPISDAVVDWFYTPMSRSGVDGYELIKTNK